MKLNLLLTLVGALFSIALHAEPLNVAQAKKEAIAYYHSGAYEQEIEQVVAHARHYINSRIESNNHAHHKQKLAIVLDIDETSLSNFPDIVKHDFAVKEKQILHDIALSHAQPVKPVLNLYNEVTKKGVHIFFVTGRNKLLLAATRKNLINAGYKNWSGLFLRNNPKSPVSIIPFKTHARQHITQQGYTIIASIGDQYSDIIGGYAEKGFKLPNPYYFLP